jgi:hypothetical protein
MKREKNSGKNDCFAHHDFDFWEIFFIKLSKILSLPKRQLIIGSLELIIGGFELGRVTNFKKSRGINSKCSEKGQSLSFIFLAIFRK